MGNYVAMQDVDLGNATVIGFNGCSVSIVDSDLVCADVFGRAVAKFPFDLNCRYRQISGLPEYVYMGEDGDFEVFEIDYDDEDYFGEEEQPTEILKSYSHISTMYFTIIIKH
jgi:hypothetical protein